MANVANETTSDAAPLISLLAHPDHVAATAKVNDLSRMLADVQAEAAAIRKTHGIKTADIRRASALRMVGRGAEADAHERLADLDAQTGVFAEAVALAAKDRDAAFAKLHRELSESAYRDHYVPVANEAVAAFVALVGAWEAARAVRRELQSYGLTHGRLSPSAADDFPTTAYPVTARPDMNGIDPLRRLLSGWIDGGFLDIDDARESFPAVSRL